MNVYDIAMRANAVLARRCDIRVLRASTTVPTPPPSREAALRVLARRCHLTVFLAVALVLALPRSASAHALDIAYLRVDGTAITLDLDATAAAQLLGAQAIDAEQLRANAGTLAALTYARDTPATPAGACTLAAPATELAGSTARLHATLSCPPGDITWRFPFVVDTELSTTFQLLVKHADQLTVVDRTVPALTFAAIASPKRPSRSSEQFLLGGLLVGVMLAPLARFALRR